MKFIFIFILCFFSILAKGSTDISFLSSNSEGREVKQTLSQQETSRRFGLFLSAISNEIEFPKISKETKHNWNVDKIYLGMALGTSIGLSKIVELKASPSFYLIFKQTK